MLLIYVGLGTAIGAIIRFLGTQMLNQSFKQYRFPWATFVINMIACLLIGVLTVKIQTPGLKLLLISGVLGGLSTFSTFANELVTLLKNQHTKRLAINYGCASLIGGLILIYIGMGI
jgi:CrcB protein